jgi:hypothetical protein
MVLFETTTALPAGLDGSALVPNSKDSEMNKAPTQRTEESSNGDDDANNDNDHDANNDDSSDDSSEDSGADGERAFGAFKSNANKNLSEHGTAMTSIRRSNSWTSFLTRSERHRAQAEVPPSPQEVAQRKVQFRDDPELEELRILELDPPLTDSEKKCCHLSDDDNARMQMEVQMTLMRWDNHEDGKIEFDDNRHSIRGLVDYVDEQCPERNRDTDIYHHMIRVLEEQIRQKTGGAQLDPERVAQIARETSMNESKRAQYIAQKDRIEAEEAWKPQPPKKLIDYDNEKAGVVKNKKRWGAGGKKDKSPKDSMTSHRDKKRIGKFAFWK